MLVIESVRTRVAALGPVPALAVVGLLVIVAGGGLDLVVHLLPAHDHSHDGFEPQEHMAHLVVVMGMTLTLAGVIADGVRRQFRRASPPAEERSSLDAVR